MTANVYFYSITKSSTRPGILTYRSLRTDVLYMEHKAESRVQVKEENKMSLQVEKVGA